jgi:hypothetical protein
MNTQPRFVLFFLFPMLFAASTLAITIDNVTINYTNNQITVEGKKLSQGATAPVITFNEIYLRVFSAFCTPTDCIAIAILPSNLSAGTYRLTVVNPVTGASYEFDVAYGAIGPQGPIGPQGLSGTTGPPGPSGP